jgi:hypothetical protein
MRPFPVYKNFVSYVVPLSFAHEGGLRVILSSILHCVLEDEIL